MTDLTAARLSSRRRRAPKGIMSYVSLYRQRRALANLDARELEDIGLTRAEALLEARRPLWDAPHHWLR